MILDESMLDLARQALVLSMTIAAPILGAGVAIGLFVAIVQSITSIQEQTLTFVPKIFGMILVTVGLLSWIVQQIADFSVVMFSIID